MEVSARLGKRLKWNSFVLLTIRKSLLFSFACNNGDNVPFLIRSMANGFPMFPNEPVITMFILTFLQRLWY